MVISKLKYLYTKVENEIAGQYLGLFTGTFRSFSVIPYLVS